MAVFLRNDAWWIDTYVKGKRVRRKIGPDKKTAELVERDLKVKEAKGEYLGIVDERKVRFEDFAKDFLKWSETNKARKTFLNDERPIQALKSHWKGKYLASIKPKDIEDWKALRLLSVSPRTINRDLAALRSLFTKAVEWGFLKEHPMKGVKGLKYQKRPPTFLTLDQVDQLLEACSYPPLYLFVVLGVYTGMRRSEIEGLRWSDVDLRRKEIRVQEDTKNNEYRIIPMAELVEKALRAAHSPFQEYVLTLPDGRTFRRSEKRFQAALGAAGLPRIRIHDLRHSFASNLVTGGTPLNVVQELMGHRDIKTTMVYAHLAPNAKRAAVDSLMQREQNEEEERVATG